MSFLKTAVIISIIIMFVITSGCTDEEPKGFVGPTQVPAQPLIQIPTVGVTVNATPTIIILIETTIPTQTPTPNPTPRQFEVSDGENLPWCALKKECDDGIRKASSEICISIHEMPQIVKDEQCGLIVWTGDENVTKVPRNESDRKV